MSIPVEVDPDEDTEWNDILRAKGVIPEKPPSPSAQFEELLNEAVEKAHNNRLENKNLDELNELEDEEDEEFLNEYKLKRFEEMQNLQKNSRFNTVYNISKPDYEKEITLASDKNFVIVHLSASSQLQSRLLSQIFNELSKKYQEIKFVEILGNRAVENYPDSNCPTLLVYHEQKVIKQYVTLLQLNGNKTILKDLENLLVEINAIKENDSRLIINQDDEDLKENYQLRFMKKSIYNNNDNSDEDDDFFD